MLILIQSPTGDIKLMRTLIPCVAITGVPEPMPVVMNFLFIVRLMRSRTKPLIIMQSCRRRTIRGNAERIAGLDAKAARHIDITNPTFMQKFHSGNYIFDRAVLKTDLHPSVIFACSFNHLASFEDVMACRLLYIHMLAGLTRPDRSQRMPVIWSGERHCIDFLIIKNLAHIPFSKGFVSGFFHYR